MAGSEGDRPNLEVLKVLADQAGLGMTPQELEDLMPLYRAYLVHLDTLHSLDVTNEELGVGFDPSWPSS